MRCPNCHTNYAAEDLYCRQCGTDLVKQSTSIVPTQTNFPAVLYNPRLPRNVAAGVGALALGVGIELLRRGLIARLRPARAVTSLLPALRGVKDDVFPPQQKVPKLPRGYEMHETVVYRSRVIRHVR